MSYFETCPHCGSEDVSGNRKKGFAHCEECGFESSVGEELPSPTPLLSADENTTAETFPLDRLPSVIALPLKEYLEEQHPVLKLWHACDVVELMLRLLVMIGIADLRRQGELPPTLLRELRDRIEEPTMGKWKGMALAVARHITGTETMLPELPGFVNDVLVPFLDGPKDEPREKWTSQNSFGQLRNGLAHGGGITRAVASRLLACWEAPFAEVVRKAALGRCGGQR